jgi:rhodanese-related sulfurtransferase
MIVAFAFSSHTKHALSGPDAANIPAAKLNRAQHQRLTTGAFSFCNGRGTESLNVRRQASSARPCHHGSGTSALRRHPSSAPSTLSSLKLRATDCFGQMPNSRGTGARLRAPFSIRGKEIIPTEATAEIGLAAFCSLSRAPVGRERQGTCFLECFWNRTIRRNEKMQRAMHAGGYGNISVVELQSLIQQCTVRLLDVRTDAEVARGRIPQAESLPLHLLPLRLNEMDKKATTVFYCQTGGRSAQAAAFAAANGFSDVHNLQGGIVAWARAGLPVDA